MTELKGEYLVKYRFFTVQTQEARASKNIHTAIETHLLIIFTVLCISDYCYIFRNASTHLDTAVFKANQLQEKEVIIKQTT